MNDKSGAIMSAAVILHRPKEGDEKTKGKGRDNLELLMVRRSPKARFFPGSWAFPGGKVDDDDVDFVTHWGETGGSRGTDPLVITAVRELWEELGLALIEPGISRSELDRVRYDLLDGMSLGKALARRGIEPTSLRPLVMAGAGKLVTPHFHPRRFATRFFAVPFPGPDIDTPAPSPSGEPCLWGDELAEMDWKDPVRLLALWESGEVILPPPIHYLLGILVEEGIDRGLATLEANIDRPLHRWFLPRFTPHVAAHDCATRTLPPATHTTCWLLGQKRLVAVDPGSGESGQQARLLNRIELLESQTGGKLSLIVLTHHHHDHVEGAAALAEARGVDVAAHPLTAAILAEEAGLKVDVELNEGDRLCLDGDGPMIATSAGKANGAQSPPASKSNNVAPNSNKYTDWQVLHTPGHSPGHICLWEPTGKGLVCGDLMTSFGRSLVYPPRGDMTAYMDTLARLSALRPRLLFPGHGPAMPGRRTLATYIAHRQEREAKVLAALGQSDEIKGTRAARSALNTPRRTIKEMLPQVYKDTKKELWRWAEGNLLAHLLKLEAEGRVVREGEDWWLILE